MKFAKELEQDLVPEWRAKYLDYKAGKKHVKAVARAAHRMNATPGTNSGTANGKGNTPLQPSNRSLYGATSPFNPKVRTPSALRRYSNVGDGPGEPLRTSPAPIGADSRPDSGESNDAITPAPRSTPAMAIASKSEPPVNAESTAAYGSFVPTPPNKKSHFELPAPAITPDLARRSTESFNGQPKRLLPPLRTSTFNDPANAYEVGPTSPPPKSGFASLRDRLAHNPNPKIRRMFTSTGGPLEPSEARRIDTDMIAFDQVRVKQKEFFKWMDKELDKVETFYKSKEDESSERLNVLREQLHEMRNRRIEEVALVQQAKHLHKRDDSPAFGSTRVPSDGSDKKDKSRNAWLDPLERIVGGAKAKAFGPHPGSNSKALQSMTASPAIRPQGDHADQIRDYVRRAPQLEVVPYRTAKRKLKLALQEYYRGMELLKSYALLNRTAFRKINKKYDKAIDAHPPLRYMSEKVNKAWFVQSDVLDGHLHAVEDLYARYFERGNHKVAVGKLRSSSGKKTDQSASAFQNGMLIGTGAVFSIQGVIYGRDLLLDTDPTVVVQTSYLLQIYGGYFLALYLFCWFCLDCSIWTRHKINYTFVFEFDPRHNLDWRQLAEFPSLLILVFGLFLWVNFTRYGSPEMYIYFPVILVFVTVVLIFFPAPVLYHRSRKWFVYSHWRLLLAGLYPVEFRDFFLGDMYCSLTYFMSNIELFFCLYANYWNDPSQCNSTHSRLLGFFSALPAIWRALQCIRRYYDTRNIFPHLVNCGKYCFTIAYCATLSMYRIDQTTSKLAIFSTIATISSIYASIWDLLMDWSVLQPDASKPLLRDVRGFKNTWWYYGAMIIDPILRFNWIFYSMYTHDLQHSTFVSFAVAFSEVTRRGIWTLFRVENEHCSNVARFKASRDVPLPYSFLNASSEDFERQPTAVSPSEIAITPSLSRPRSHGGTGLEAQVTDGGSLRRRPTPVRTFTKVIADAHTQDFERKKKPGVGDSDSPANRRRDEEAGRAEEEEVSSDDEDEGGDEEEVAEAEELIRVRTKGGQGS